MVSWQSGHSHVNSVACSSHLLRTDVIVTIDAPPCRFSLQFCPCNCRLTYSFCHLKMRNSNNDPGNLVLEDLRGKKKPKTTVSPNSLLGYEPTTLHHTRLKSVPETTQSPIPRFKLSPLGTFPKHHRQGKMFFLIVLNFDITRFRDIFVPWSERINLIHQEEQEDDNYIDGQETYSNFYRVQC